LQPQAAWLQTAWLHDFCAQPSSVVHCCPFDLWHLPRHRNFLLNGTFYCTTWMQKMVQQHYAECRKCKCKNLFSAESNQSGTSSTQLHYGIIKTTPTRKIFSPVGGSVVGVSEASQRIRRWSIWGQVNHDQKWVFSCLIFSKKCICKYIRQHFVKWLHLNKSSFRKVTKCGNVECEFVKLPFCQPC
jgi:hypothetical protein